MKWRWYFMIAFLTVLTVSGMSEAKNPDVFKLGVMTSFTGPFSGVAETQKKGILLKIDQINREGGLSMPWGKVKVEAVVKDDKMEIDTGVQLFNKMVNEEGIHALVGSVYNPMAAALNEACKKTGTPYLPGCVPAMDSFKKGSPADSVFSVAFTPWSIGYLAGGCMVKTLSRKNIWFVSRPDSWGKDMLKGLEKAADTFGGKLIGVSDADKGTKEYKDIIKKAKNGGADAFATCMFGSDAVANLTQAHELGLNENAVLFNTWITNLVAAQLPGKALSHVYALEYFYYNLDTFEDQELAELAHKFTEAHMKMWNEPPDAYGAIAYTAADILFQAVEKAGSFDNSKIARTLSSSHFKTVKGDVYFRKDHQMVAKYMAFLVQGKEADEMESKFDVFDVIGFFGGEESLPSLNSLGY